MKPSERGHLFGGLAPLPVIRQRYTDGAAVLIATGPSLTKEQIELVRPLHERNLVAAFGCNDSYRICPFLDYLYAADFRWIEHHDEKVPKRLRDRGFCYTAEDKRTDPYTKWTQVPSKAAHGLSTDPNLLHRGNHSGYQMINLAYLMGIRTMFLIGYDAHSGGKHFFGPHPTRAMQVDSNYSYWLPNYRTIQDRASALGLTIINCTPGSAIDAFPRISLDVCMEKRAQAK